MLDIAADIELIANSLQKLPGWHWDHDDDWWPRFAELTGFSRRYLAEKLAGLTSVWDLTDRPTACEACRYVLMFFDNSALYELLDLTESTWERPVSGRLGQRWSETICSAAWRVIVATQPEDRHSDAFSVHEDWWPTRR